MCVCECGFRNKVKEALNSFALKLDGGEGVEQKGILETDRKGDLFVTFIVETYSIRLRGGGGEAAKLG